MPQGFTIRAVVYSESGHKNIYYVGYGDIFKDCILTFTVLNTEFKDCDSVILDIITVEDDMDPNYISVRDFMSIVND